jgi:hypothetical protein
VLEELGVLGASAAPEQLRAVEERIRTTLPPHVLALRLQLRAKRRSGASGAAVEWLRRHNCPPPLERASHAAAEQRDEANPRAAQALRRGSLSRCQAAKNGAGHNLRGIENRDWLKVLKRSAQICAVAGRPHRRRLATNREETSECQGL